MADTTRKIIRGVVNSRGFTITSAITQWDYGWQFIPEIEDLPATYRLDFSNEEKHGTALPVYCSTEGAEVPTELIDTGKDIWVWFVRIGDGYGITEYKWRIPNHCKPKTEEDEPTPSQQSSIDQLIVRSNEAVTSAEQSASEAGQSARNASQDADRAERARTGAETAQGKAEDAQGSAERARDDAETSERNASESERKAKGYAETASAKADAITGLTAQATTLPDGSSATASYNAETGVMSFGIPKGKDGIDGNDGYSTTASVTKSGKVATITITDKNGTTNAQVSDGEDGATGATPNLTIGTVDTLEPTEPATATITGTPENPVLNLGIPQGDTGEVTTEEFLKAFVTDSASGAIASFPDGADDIPLKSLVVDIDPVQEGTGDPSPENICPISGWTGIQLKTMGKNLLDPTLLKDQVAWNIIPFYAPVGTVLTMSTNQPGESTSGLLTYLRTPGGAQGSNENVLNTHPAIKTVGEEGYLEIVQRNRDNIKSYADYEYQIELGYTATAYEPHVGQTIPINWQTEAGTVYGCKLDVLRGKLRITHAYANLPTTGWTLSGTNFWRNLTAMSNTNPANVGWCTHYANETRITGNNTIIFGYSSFSGTPRIVVRDSRFTTASDFMAFLAEQETNGTPVMIAYPLATPIEIQLDAHTLNSLYGQNNIFADTGDTEVEYRADTKLYIEKLTQPEEDDMIADSNIVGGQYFMVGNSLYLATSNIANGSAIVVGTNCTRKSLSEALNEINA